MDRYEKLGRVGEGAHGVVYMARLLKPIAPKPLNATPSSIQPEEEEAKHSTATPQSPRHAAIKRHRDGTPASIRLIAHSLKDSLLQLPQLPLPTNRPAAGLESVPDAPLLLFDRHDRDHSLEVGSVVAIKKIRLRSVYDGLSLEAIREIKLLQELDHPNIVRIFDVFNHNANINLVMDWMHFDLEKLIRDQSAEIAEGDVKFIMQQILRGSSIATSAGSCTAT